MIKRYGFTLVELLVVMAIVGVLASLLMPAVLRSRESGRRAECANKLRQMGIALHLYIDEHKGFLPQYPPTIFEALAPYLEIEDTPYWRDDFFKCPTAPKNEWSSMTINVNFAAMTNFESLRYAALVEPSQTVYMFDYDPGPYGVIYANWYHVLDPNKGYTADKGDDVVGDWHSRGANVLWTDGHVSWHLKETLINTVEWWSP